MKLYTSLLAAGLFIAMCACGSDSDTSGAAGANTGGVAGQAGGQAGQGEGGAAGQGEAGQAGSAGQGEGGSAGQGEAGSGGTAGAGGDVQAFWDDAYDANCKPTPSNGEHKAGQPCMGCHGPTFVFAGTVFDRATSKGIGSVEVAAKSGALIEACSATNGNFWVPGSASVDWAKAEIRMRNSKGEVVGHTNVKANADCNSCHKGNLALYAP